MPFISVYIHFVWSTKNRIPFLETKELQNIMWNHIRENAKKKNIFIDHINGHKEHCHCLISLGFDQTMKQCMQLLKGESSHWFNRQKLIKDHFEWQDEYFAISVSKSKLDPTRIYIRNQEEHHKKKSFDEEYDELITKLGFKKFKDSFG